MWNRIVADAPNFFTYYNAIFILQAMGRTLGLTIIGCVSGFVFGFIVAAIRSTTARSLLPLRAVALLYVEIFRRIPFLVILFLVMFGVQAISRDMPLFAIAVVSICLLSTAFMSEIIRAGMASVPKPQREAAEAMNFGYARTLFLIILPQAWKVILPPGFAYMVMFIKDTALASQMGVMELAFAGKNYVGRGFSPALVYTIILVCYFVMSYPLSRLGTYLENRLATSRSRESMQRVWAGPGPVQREPVGEQG
ncbi:amino acid ABC transporter permease [Labrys monachus]|uniref:Polar amino acid transport system permease protein n=1 Tax=Labrys monachus TaxID=217067 RepID=A0ABU0F8W6_9HYPH|nr:amino acid ABC transporter permease [Labrys monachus]MDQ0390510.1 polar amino acid transport system permease protein [Labrys monachus]